MAAIRDYVDKVVINEDGALSEVCVRAMDAKDRRLYEGLRFRSCVEF